MPHPPGGGYDAYSRLIAPFLARTLGTDVVVENVVGASGIVGANAIKNAKPDGTTIGIINTPGLLLASLRGDDHAPDLLADFSVLGRVGRSQHVWATGRDSGLRSIDDVLRQARETPILFGIQDVASSSFTVLTVSSDLIGVQFDVIAGYPGTAASCMAAVRGEVDLVSFTFESIRQKIEMDELRPLLQLTEARISPHPALDGVPILGGANGLAVERARVLGRNTEKAEEDAAVLSQLMELGRMVVAPPGLEASTLDCLGSSLYETLEGSELERAAAKGSWPLEPMQSEDASRALRATAPAVSRFVPVLQRALRRSMG